MQRCWSSKVDLGQEMVCVGDLITLRGVMFKALREPFVTTRCLQWLTLHSNSFCFLLSDSAPQVKHLTRPELSFNLTTNRKLNSSKSGGEVPEVNTKTRGKSTAGKLLSPNGRQANSEEKCIFNV